MGLAITELDAPEATCSRLSGGGCSEGAGLPMTRCALKLAAAAAISAAHVHAYLVA